MKSNDALLSFSPLAQGTRLAVFRLLVEAEPDGLVTGEIARRLGVPQNTSSSHLGILTRAEWATAERRSRSIAHRARIDAIRSRADVLFGDCRRAHPEAVRVAPTTSRRSTSAARAPVPDRRGDVPFPCTGRRPLDPRREPPAQSRRGSPHGPVHRQPAEG